MSLPPIRNSQLCLRAALLDYRETLSEIKLSSDTPLLLSTGEPLGGLLSSHKFRAMFRRVALAVGLGHRNLTPHSLRRYIFLAGVPVDHYIYCSRVRGARLPVERHLLVFRTPRFDTPVAMSFSNTVK